MLSSPPLWLKYLGSIHYIPVAMDAVFLHSSPFLCVRQCYIISYAGGESCLSTLTLGFIPLYEIKEDEIISVKFQQPKSHPSRN